MWREYLHLTKYPRVIANMLPALAAYIFASRPFEPSAFLFLLFGLALVIASANVFNNIYDRGIDARMERTRNRAIAAGRVTIRKAALYGGALLCAGAALLWFTTLVAFMCAMAGFIVYVALYTPLKHVSPHSLWPGALAGATPIAAGYGAAAGMFDLTALILFVLMFAWQIPHFLSIAKYRHAEYEAAGVPLFVKAPASERARRTARKVYYASLAILLLGCLCLIFQR